MMKLESKLNQASFFISVGVKPFKTKYFIIEIFDFIHLKKKRKLCV